MYDYVELRSDDSYSTAVACEVIEEYVSQHDGFTPKSKYEFSVELNGRTIPCSLYFADSSGCYSKLGSNNSGDVNLVEIDIPDNIGADENLLLVKLRSLADHIGYKIFDRETDAYI